MSLQLLLFNPKEIIWEDNTSKKNYRVEGEEYIKKEIEISAVYTSSTFAAC